MRKYILFSAKQSLPALLVMLCNFFAVNARGQVDTLFKHNSNERLIDFWKLTADKFFGIGDSTYVYNTIDSIARSAKQCDDSRMYWYAGYFKILYKARREGDFNIESRYLYTMNDWIEKCPLEVIKASNKHKLGYLAFLNKKPAEGLNLLLQAENEFEKIGFKNIPEMFHYLYELSIAYYILGDYPKCIKYAEMSEAYPIVITREGISNPNTEGLTYESLGDYKRAADYFLKCLKRARYYNDSAWIAIASGNYGRVLINLGDYKNATGYLYTNYKLNIKSEPENAMYAVIDLAGCYAKTGNITLAKFYLNEGARLRNSTKSVSFDSYYKSVYNYYKTVGDLPLAYKFADSLINISDSIDAVNSASLLKSTQGRIETEDHLSQMALQQEKEKNRQAVRNVFIVSTSVILGIVLMLVYSRYRSVAKDKMMAIKEKHIAEIERQAVQERLLHADDQLNTYIKSIAEKNALVEKINAKLLEQQKEKPGDPDDSEDIERQQKTAELLDLTILTEDDWKKYKLLFNEVHPNFFVALKENYPAFTQAETRLLSLMKLNIPHKEMSYMTGVSSETITKTKYRIKKKLNDLDINKELEQFVAEL